MNGSKMSLIWIILFIFAVACIVIFFLTMAGVMTDIDKGEATLYFIGAIVYFLFFFVIRKIPSWIAKAKRKKAAQNSEEQ